MSDLILGYHACGAECREDWPQMLSNDPALPLLTVQRLDNHLGQVENSRAIAAL